MGFMVCWYPLWGLTVVSKDAFVLNRQIRLYTSSTVHLWHCYLYHSWTFWCHVCFPYCVLLSNPPQTLHVWNIYSTYMNGFNLWYMYKGTYSIPFFGHYKTHHFYPAHFNRSKNRNVSPLLGSDQQLQGAAVGRAFPMPLRQAGGPKSRGGGNVKIWWSPLLLLPYSSHVWFFLNTSPFNIDYS